MDKHAQIAAYVESLNVVLLVAKIGYERFDAGFENNGARSILVESVSAIQKTLASTTYTTVPDRRGADAALEQLASLLTQDPVDAALVSTVASRFSICLGLVQPSQKGL